MAAGASAACAGTARSSAVTAVPRQAIGLVRSIVDSVIPPTINYEVPDPECDLDPIPGTAREQKVDVALSVGSGFGGFQSAIVLSHPSRRPA